MTNNDDLVRQIQKTGTAEISNGVVNQVTQAIDEKSNTVKFLMFGEMVEKRFIPIDQACAECDHRHFPTVKECQEKQGKDARARGFYKIVCPQQLR